MKLKALLTAVGCILLSLLAGAVGSIATIPNIPTWYVLLDKPPLLPPNWVFAPVWTTLYIAMGLALFLVIQARTTQSKQNAYYLFGVQLVLNALWSVVFFGAHLLWPALIIIVLLLFTLVFTFRSFSRLSRPASLLLAPYIAWVMFATYLTAGVAILNS
jgi:tryptophan-rich sensory protein